MRLIDADALDETFSRLNDDGRQLTRGDHKRVEAVLFEMPTIDAVPVVHGKWLALHEDNRLMCSRCKWKEHVPTAMGEPTIWEYCPSCGAKMDGDINGKINGGIKVVVANNAHSTIDAVPVVRCEECRHLKVVMKEPVYAVCEKNNHTFYLWQEDTRKHFCSWGEWAEGKTMRLIDADALVDDGLRFQDGYDYDGIMMVRLGDVTKSIRNAPTIDAVPVVRCAECRWWEKREDSPMGYCHACKHGYYSTHWEISIHRTYKGDFFCADGERKDGDGDGC